MADITVKLDGKTYFEILRKSQLYDEMDNPHLIPLLQARIAELEAEIDTMKLTLHISGGEFKTRATPIDKTIRFGEAGDSFSECVAAV